MSAFRSRELQIFDSGWLDATAEPVVVASHEAKFVRVGAACFESALLFGREGGGEKAHVKVVAGSRRSAGGERRECGDRRDFGARANERVDVVAERGRERWLNLPGEFPAVG